MNQLALKPDELNAYLIPASDDKDAVSRLRRYVDWLNLYERAWWDVDLVQYRDFLLRVGGNDGNGLSPSSAQAHLSTIRGRYQFILRERVGKSMLYQIATHQLEARGVEVDPANIKAVVDEYRAAIIDAIHPSSAPVTVITDQDPDHLRLTIDQANDLLRSLDAIRDKAAVALALATGIREGELCALHVADLQAFMDDGSLALRVREGKGAKARKVPYGEMVGVLDIVWAWIEHAGIERERVFPFTPRTFQRILKRHPIQIGWQLVEVKPHDLRRTYARRCYEAGMALAAIQQNLGHTGMDTTLLYIGELDGEARRPPDIFGFA